MQNDQPAICENELTLRVSGLGNVPAFKNKKIIVGRRLITAPKAKKWMTDASTLLNYQLKSLFQTKGGATSTVPWQQYAMSSLPSDDNWKVIPKISVSVREVSKDEAGCIIRLKKISPSGKQKEN